MHNLLLPISLATHTTQTRQPIHLQKDADRHEEINVHEAYSLEMLTCGGQSSWKDSTILQQKGIPMQNETVE